MPGSLAGPTMLPVRRRNKLGSRRVPIGWKGVRCLLCSAPTLGLPSEGMRPPGPHATKFWQYGGIIAVCANAACLDHFDALVCKDAEEGRASQPTEETDEPMSENDQEPKPDPYTEFKGDLFSFARQATQRALTSVWKDSGSLYGTVRNLVTRTAMGIAWGAAGGTVGAAAGLMMGPNRDRGAESERDRLLSQVRIGQAIREAIPMVTSMISNMEYDARKKLEEQGYYPCEECGTPHVKDEPHTMPPGTYWSEAKNRYLRPDDEDWSQEGYEACTNEKWERDDEPEEQVH